MEITFIGRCIRSEWYRRRESALFGRERRDGDGLEEWMMVDGIDVGKGRVGVESWGIKVRFGSWCLTKLRQRFGQFREVFQTAGSDGYIVFGSADPTTLIALECH